MIKFNSKTYTKANKNFDSIFNNLHKKVKNGQIDLIISEKDLYIYQDNTQPKTYAVYTNGVFSEVIKIKILNCHIVEG